MSRNVKIAAAVIAVIAIALVVWWRRGGSSDHAAGGGGASGSDEAAGSASDDPWTKRPKAPIHGVAADDDPTIVSFGAPATVEGTVRDAATKQPVPNADVAFWSKRGELTTTAGGDGHYKLDLTTGAWNARASVADTMLSKAQVVRVDAPHLTVDLEVDKLAHVHGIVRDAQTHAPVGGADVAVDPPTKEESEALEATVGRATLTASDGSYKLAAMPGELRVEATAPGKIAHRSLPAIAPGADVTLDLELHANADIDGRVVDAKGAGVGGATVSMFVSLGDIDLNKKSTLTTGADGRFAVKGMMPGTLVIEARTDDGAATDPKVIDLAQQAGKDIVLVLAPAAPLRGHVAYGDGSPARDAQVRVHRTGLATLFASTNTDKDGNFEVHGPSNGRFIIDAISEYGTAHLIDATTDVVNQLVIHVPGGIRGKVHTKTGAVKDFTVAIDHIRPAGNARDIPPPAPQRYTPADGAFEWPKLDPGTYDLTVRVEGQVTSHVTGVVVPDGAWANIDVAIDAKGAVGLTGIVHAGDKPIAGARVDATCTGGQQMTAADGTFLFADAGGGSCALTITADGYATTLRTALAGVPTDIELAPGHGKTEIDGVGVILQPYQDSARVVGVLSPQAAPLHVGDVIVAIDGNAAAGMRFGQILALVRGDAGTTCRLTVERGGAKLDVEIVRGKISSSGVDPGMA